VNVTEGISMNDDFAEKRAILDECGGFAIEDSGIDIESFTDVFAPGAEDGDGGDETKA